ncbi:hypothetical protein EDD27_3138 [Nonomuraea polychroma]|uniref:GyrI-like small molecule binding domain-containing protein n=1 Tax=Nonomuraea polychroma TaxID=46176 RepID=A0A438M4H8_9ACTN|nr:hypothetical protein [Nonomuraea polychroma]RVX40719.1 hypothetical protein EDD27_3138 [Nonomuraea polychroma]
MTPEVVTHGPVTRLSVSGVGAPGGAEHAAAIRALYAVAGAMGGPGGPLEGMWWVEDERPGLEVERELWRWHVLLPPAGLLEAGALEAGALEAGALERAREAARGSGAAVDRVQVVTFTEGLCVEMVHEGPFSEEHVSLAVMEEFMAAGGLVPCGMHHEVYLTAFDDPLPRTVLRQPVRAAG